MNYRSSDKTVVFITAGDPSGDVHGARLMYAIREQVPDAVFIGFGGSHMTAAGLHSLAHMKDLAVTGFWEVAKRYRFFTQLLRKCSETLTSVKPAVFIPIDYPGFNMRLAAASCKAGVPVVWYIAPQLWAWGAKRAEKLARVVNKLLVVFPFETTFFAKYGIHAEHVGHPLLDDPDFATLNVPANDSIVIMPGSRKQEIARHTPIVSGLMKLVRTQDLKVVIPKPEFLPMDLYEPFVEAGAEVVTNARQALKLAHAGVIKAGTSTLEASLLGLPFTTYYQTSALSYHLSKRLVTIPSVTMMNLLLKKNVVHEYIQDQATPEALYREIQDLLGNDNRRRELIDASNEVRSLLGGPGAAVRAASVITDVINNRRNK